MKNSTPIKNKYTCDTCKGVIVTIDLDEGATPSILPCKANSKCGGFMHSAYYSPAAVGDAEPEYEWYKPNRADRRNGNKAFRDYYARGGLALRRIEDES